MMFTVNDVDSAVAVECRSAVHIASTISQASRDNEHGAAHSLVWDTTASCSADGASDAAWLAVRFAYPLPAGSTLVDIRSDERPIEIDGRLVGVAIASQPFDRWRPIRFSVRTNNRSEGPAARITPPILEGDEPQIVAFGNPDFSFEPRESLSPQSRASAMAITLGDLSHDSYRDALREGKSLGVHWDGPAIVLRATRPIKEEQGIEGELVERGDRTQGVFIGVGIAVGAAIVGLVLLALRFKRRSEDEHAEATLRAEIDAL